MTYVFRRVRKTGKTIYCLRHVCVLLQRTRREGIVVQIPARPASPHFHKRTEENQESQSEKTVSGLELSTSQK